jgi:predicted RNA-binding protein with PIN domain
VPASPAVVAVHPLPHFENEDWICAVNSLVVVNDRAIRDVGAVMYVFDVSTPAAPRLVCDDADRPDVQRPRRRPHRELREDGLLAGVGRRRRPRREQSPRWIVDGMNLIGSRPDGWWKDPAGAVRRLMGELDRYGTVTGEEVIVVSDVHPPDVAAGRHGAVVVAFPSRRGRNAADDEIVRMVAEDPAPGSITVVTSDDLLVQRVRELGSGVMSSMTFRRRLDEMIEGRAGPGST